MELSWLSWIAAPARWLWDKIRGRPTVQADHGAVAAGRDQTIKDFIITADQALRTEMGAFVAATQHFHASVTIINLPRYRDELPDVAFEEPPETFKEGERLEAAADHDGAIAQYEKAFAAAQHDYHRSVLHNRIGWNFMEMHRLPEAEGHALQAVDLARRASEPKREAFALWTLGLVHRRQHRLKEAEICISQALETYERLGELEGQAYCLSDLANLHRQRADPGDLAKAEDFYKRALELYEGLGHWSGQGQSLSDLARLYRDRGDPGDLAKAEEFYKRALELCEGLGGRKDQALSLRNLAGLYRDRGDPGDLAKAKELYKRALTLSKDADDQKGTAEALANLGIIHLQSAWQALANLDTAQPESAQMQEFRQEVEQGQHDIVRSVALYHQLGDLRNEAFGTVVLASALLLGLDFAGAKGKVRYAQELFSQAGDPARAEELSGMLKRFERLERLDAAASPKRKGPRKKP